MARVMFYTGVLLLAFSAVLLYLPTCFSFILALIVFLVIIFFIIFKKCRFNGIFTMLCVALAFLTLGVFTVCFKVKPVEKLSGYNATVIGTVVKAPDYYEDYTVYEIKSESIVIEEDNFKDSTFKIPQKLKLRLSDINSLNFKFYEKVKINVIFNNIGEYKSLSFSSGVYAGGYINSLTERIGFSRPFYACFSDLKKYINGLIYDNINYN